MSITKIKTASIRFQWVQLKLKGNQSMYVSLYQGATGHCWVSKPVAGAVESWTKDPKSICVNVKDIEVVSRPSPNLEEIFKFKNRTNCRVKSRNEKVSIDTANGTTGITTDTVLGTQEYQTKLIGESCRKRRSWRFKNSDDEVAAFAKDAKAKYKDAWPMKNFVV